MHLLQLWNHAMIVMVHYCKSILKPTVVKHCTTVLTILYTVLYCTALDLMELHNCNTLMLANQLPSLLSMWVTFFIAIVCTTDTTYYLKISRFALHCTQGSHIFCTTSICCHITLVHLCRLLLLTVMLCTEKMCSGNQMTAAVPSFVTFG